MLDPAYKQQMMRSQRTIDRMAVGMYMLGMISQMKRTQLTSLTLTVEDIQTLAAVGYYGLLWLWINYTNERIYNTCRNGVFFTFQILHSAVFLWEGVNFGSALDKPPSNDWITMFLGEPFNVLLGFRLIVLGLRPLAMPLPLPYHILAQFFSILSTRKSVNICTTQV